MIDYGKFTVDAMTFLPVTRDLKEDSKHCFKFYHTTLYSILVIVEINSCWPIFWKHFSVDLQPKLLLTLN